MAILNNTIINEKHRSVKNGTKIDRSTLVYSVRAETRRQNCSTSAVNMPNGQLIFISALCMSTNDCVGTSIIFGITNKFVQVGKFTNKGYVNNEN